MQKSDIGKCDSTKMDYVLIACLLFIEFAETVFGWISDHRRCQR